MKNAQINQIIDQIEDVQKSLQLDSKTKYEVDQFLIIQANKALAEAKRALNTVLLLRGQRWHYSHIP